MARKRIDLTGQRFGRLVAIKDAGYAKNRSRVWECICDCGNTTFARAQDLTSRHTKSCGCDLSKSAHRNIQKAHKWMQAQDLKEHTELSSLNSKIASNNTSGVKGVSLSKENKMWNARLYFKGTLVLNSRFVKKEDAIRARRDAEEKYFKPILKKYHRVEIEVEEL